MQRFEVDQAQVDHLARTAGALFTQSTQDSERAVEQLDWRPAA